MNGRLQRVVFCSAQLQVDSHRGQELVSLDQRRSILQIGSIQATDEHTIRHGLPIATLVYALPKLTSRHCGAGFSDFANRGSGRADGETQPFLGGDIDCGADGNVDPGIQWWKAGTGQDNLLQNGVGGIMVNRGLPVQSNQSHRACHGVSAASTKAKTRGAPAQRLERQ